MPVPSKDQMKPSVECEGGAVLNGADDGGGVLYRHPDLLA
jgi:hypothetical protein